MRGVDEVVTEWLSHVLIMEYFVTEHDVAVLPDKFSHALD